jgi:succinate dehydrogenase/fumarate reductase flavoprotein subunit
LRAAFGPVIDRLAANAIDLTKMPVEVAPIAHYHMGGVVADTSMQTELSGLFVAGEAVGGPNGANRLSGNAITEALVFGRRAGQRAAVHAKKEQARPRETKHARSTTDLISAGSQANGLNPAEMIQALQATMADDVGPLRDDMKLRRALATIGQLADALGDLPPGDGKAFDMQRLDWFDLRNMLLVARTVADAALRRRESRGAHQREDYPGMLPEWGFNQVVRSSDGGIVFSEAAVAAAVAAQ